MPANQIDTNTYYKVMTLQIDGQHPRRFSRDAAKRSYYAASRARRYSRYLGSLAK